METTVRSLKALRTLRGLRIVVIVMIVVVAAGNSVNLTSMTLSPHAGSAIFCRRRADIDPYNTVFDQFWRRHSARILPADMPSDSPIPPKEEPKERFRVLEALDALFSDKEFLDCVTKLKIFPEKKQKTEN